MARYPVVYAVDLVPDGVEREDLDGRGGTDAIIVQSLIYPEDGSLSHMLLSLDGRTGEALAPRELFKAWTMMASGLSQMEGLDLFSRDVAATALQMVRERILAARHD